MANSANVQIDGLKELYALLQDLPTKVEKNVMRGALRRGQTVFRDAAKALITDRTGALSKSVRIRFKTKSEKRGWIRSHLIAGSKDAYYAHIVEFGSASYYTGKGKTVGKPYTIKGKNGRALLIAGGNPVSSVTHPGARPKPFMRPAFDANNQRAINETAAYIRDRLPKEIKKANKAKL
jgi:HK97 gp10 family phage protein